MVKKVIKGVIKKFKRFKNFFKFIRLPGAKSRRVLRDACDGLRIEAARNGVFKVESPCFTNEPNCIFCVRDQATLEIGHNTFFNRNCMIVAREKISIGANCMFGPNVYICDHDHAFDKNTVYPNQFKTKPVSIGQGTWIGANCIILKGTNIGNNCIIGAGTVITEDIPDDMIVFQKKINTLRKRE